MKAYLFLNCTIFIFIFIFFSPIAGYKGYEDSILAFEDPVELTVEKLLDMRFKLDEHGYIGQKNIEGENHGRGVLRQTKKDGGGQYRGEWRKGMRHGRGKVISPEGDVYIGDWRFDRQHGNGTLTTSDGDRYTGQWKFGEQEGEGEYKWANGDSYTGAWRDSEPHGWGTSVEGPTVYKGEWDNGAKHGKGIVTRVSDGKILFDGSFYFGKPIKAK